jgi:hypothetical protein
MARAAGCYGRKGSGDRSPGSKARRLMLIQLVLDGKLSPKDGARLLEIRRDLKQDRDRHTRWRKLVRFLGIRRRPID